MIIHQVVAGFETQYKAPESGTLTTYLVPQALIRVSTKTLFVGACHDRDWRFRLVQRPDPGSNSATLQC